MQGYGSEGLAIRSTSQHHEDEVITLPQNYLGEHVNPFHSFRVDIYSNAMVKPYMS